MSDSVPLQPSGLPTPARLRQIVDAIEEGVAILDADGVVEFLNPRAQRLLQVSADDVVGRHLLSFGWKILDESGCPMPRENHPALRVLETGHACSQVVLGMRASSVGNATVWFEVTSAPLPPEAGQGRAGSLSTFRDVSARIAAETALRGSERRFQSLAEAVPVGVFHARDGRCLWTNQGWCAISGQTRAEAMGAGWQDALHPEDRALVRAAWNSAVEHAELFSLDHRIVRPDGEVRWVTCRAAVLSEEEHGTSGLLGTVTDITEARAAGELKDQIIGLVSHELRTPLISIRGGLTFLAPYVENADANGRRLYDMAVRNAELLERLVTDLLDIERLETGSLVLDVEVTDVGRLLEEARTFAIPYAEARGVMLEPVPDVDVSVPMDRDRILQVLTNLLSNAIKFSGPGDSVRMRVDRVGSGGGLRFRIADQGRGVPVDQSERIFERFVQILPSDATDRGGAGLGLAIARAIVQHHGGSIWVERREGRGSTFCFLLPSAAASTTLAG